MFQSKLLSTCLSIIHRAEGAGEERELQSLLAGHEGLAFVANHHSLSLACLGLRSNLCNLLNTVKRMCHPFLACTHHLQSAFVVWSFCCCCPLSLEGAAVDMNWCYFLLLIIFKMAVQIFLKEQTSKSLKSKHLVAM